MKVNIELERGRKKFRGRKNNSYARQGTCEVQQLRLHWSRLYFERAGMKAQTHFSACFHTIQRFGLCLSLNIRENKLSLPELTFT